MAGAGPPEREPLLPRPGAESAGGSKAAMVLMHLLMIPLVLLDFLLWLITLGPVWMLLKFMKMPQRWAAPHGTAAINGKLEPSEVWRAPSAIERGELASTPFPDVQTLYDLLDRAYSKYAKRPAQGVRPLLRMRKDEGYRFEAKEFGATEWTTYGELGVQAKAFGAGLRALGLEPQPAGDFDALEGKFKILIYEDTCAEWMVCCQGSLSQDIVVATAYATLGLDAVVAAVTEGSIAALVCNRASAKKVAERAAEMPSLEVIIYTEHLVTPEARSSRLCLSGLPGSLRVLALEEVIELGKEAKTPPHKPRPDSVAVLMYTSGSTGKPKGVVVRHRQLLGMVAACGQQFGVLLEEGAETFIAYLPLAHILELAAEMYFYGMGNRIGYADPKCLLPGPEKCYPTGGLEEFRPTLMAGVPKVWETIKKGAEAKLSKASPAVGFLFKVALRLKKMAVRQHRYTPLFDLLVFKKFKTMIGGRMKFTLSGGGAISAEVQEWVRTAFGCPLVQGYGLTETCGGATIQHPYDTAVGIAGSCLSSVEITLHSEPEITDSNGKPYLTTDLIHADDSPCQGRGEVWLRGNSITSGYYRMPEATAEEFGENGWFHTGDIGMMTPSGQLRIVDRKKNLVKLKGGEYVALEMMNTTYNNAPIVNVDAGGVCTYADHSIDRPVAFVQCKREELLHLAEEAGVSGADAKLCREPRVMELVKARLDAVAKANKLPALMNVIAVMPVLDPWTPENGCLTATSKLVSKSVYKRHAEDLELLKPMARKG